MERKYLNEGTLMCFIWRHKKHKNVFLTMASSGDEADCYKATTNFVEALWNQFRWQEYFTERYMDNVISHKPYVGVYAKPYGDLKLSDFERVRVCVEE